MAKDRIIKISDHNGVKVYSSERIKLRGGSTAHISKQGKDRFKMDIWGKDGYCGTSVEFGGHMFEEVLKWFR